MNLQNIFLEICKNDISTESKVRQLLAQLEYKHSLLCLAALKDWETLEIFYPFLYQPISSMVKPAWGAFNRLLLDLNKAKKEVYLSSSTENVSKIEQLSDFLQILAYLDQKLAKDETVILVEQTKFLNSEIHRPRVVNLFEVAIQMRNKIAHGNPEQDWYNQALELLKTIIPLITQKDNTNLGYDGVWFYQNETDFYRYNGFDTKGVEYLSSNGKHLLLESMLSPITQSFTRLLGIKEKNSDDIKKLMRRAAPEEIKGVILKDYLVGKPVAEGGFAYLHKGINLNTGAEVAVKILKNNDDLSLKERFQHEAELMSRIMHNNIVKIYDYGEFIWTLPKGITLKEEDWFKQFSTSSVKNCIVLEWIDGLTLEQLYDIEKISPNTAYLDILKQSDILKNDAEIDSNKLLLDSLPKNKKQNFTQLVEWFKVSALALQHVHDQNLIHRDLKPSNIMVSAFGEIKIMDFGIAKSYNDNQTMLTATGQTIGTPAYMSPEQIVAENKLRELTPKTDIYSLGATFYELITNSRLYNHDKTTIDTVNTHKTTGILPIKPIKISSEYDWTISEILLGTLQTEAVSRYASMRDLAADIERYQNNEAIHYKKPNLFKRIRLIYKRNFKAYNVGIAAVIVLVVFGWFSIDKIIKEKNSTTESLVQSYNNKAQEYINNLDHASALIYYRRAMMLKDNPASRMGIMECMPNIVKPIASLDWKMDFGYMRSFYAISNNKQAICYSLFNTIYFRNIADLRLSDSLNFKFQVSGLAFNSSDQSIYILHDDGMISEYDIKTRELLRQKRLANEFIFDLFVNDKYLILNLLYSDKTEIWSKNDLHKIMEISGSSTFLPKLDLLEIKEEDSLNTKVFDLHSLEYVNKKELDKNYNNTSVLSDSLCYELKDKNILIKNSTKNVLLKTLYLENNPMYVEVLDSLFLIVGDGGLRVFRINELIKVNYKSVDFLVDIIEKYDKNKLMLGRAISQTFLPILALFNQNSGSIEKYFNKDGENPVFNYSAKYKTMSWVDRNGYIYMKKFKSPNVLKLPGNLKPFGRIYNLLVVNDSIMIFEGYLSVNLLNYKSGRLIKSFLLKDYYPSSLFIKSDTEIILSTYFAPIQTFYKIKLYGNIASIEKANSYKHRNIDYFRNSPLSLNFFDSLNCCYLAIENSEVSIWSTNWNKTNSTLFPAQVHSVVLSADSKYLAITSWGLNKIWIYSYPDLRFIKVFNTDYNPYGVLFDGGNLIAGGWINDRGTLATFNLALDVKYESFMNRLETFYGTMINYDFDLNGNPVALVVNKNSSSIQTELLPPAGVDSMIVSLDLTKNISEIISFLEMKVFDRNFSIPGLSNILEYLDLDIKPNSQLYNTLGKCYDKWAETDKDNATALKYYEKAIKLNPNYAEAYNNIGNMYNKKDDYDSAIFNYQICLKIKPDQTKVLNMLGITYYNKGDLKSAQSYYSKALQIDSANTDILTNLGDVHYDLEEYDDAIKYYLKAVKINHSKAILYTNLGSCYDSKDDKEMALNYFKKALELNTNDETACNNLGSVYHDLKKYDEALKSYKKAIQINPLYASPYNNLGAAYNDLGDYDQAIKYSLLAITFDSTNVNTNNHLGFAYAMKGEVAKGIKLIESCIKKNPGYAGAYRNLARIYLKIGNKKSANKNYIKAAEFGNKEAQEYCKKNNIKWE